MYAAPILGGGTQGMRICLEHIYRQHGSTPTSLEFEVWFKRPVFWEDELELWFGQKPGGAAGVWRYVDLLCIYRAGCFPA